MSDVMYIMLLTSIAMEEVRSPVTVSNVRMTIEGCDMRVDMVDMSLLVGSCFQFDNVGVLFDVTPTDT